MFTGNRKFPTILAAAIGVLGLGIIGWNGAFQGALAPAANKAPRKLLEERRDAAKQTWEITVVLRQRAYRAANGDINRDISDLSVWSERWLDAELGLCDTKEQRITALKAHVDRTRDLEQAMIQRVKSGRSAGSSAATYERINAEIRYFEEAGKSPPPSETKRADEQLPLPKQKT